MPPHMTAILGAKPVVGMVAVCDTILYKAICNVLMPHVLQPLPERYDNNNCEFKVNHFVMSNQSYCYSSMCVKPKCQYFCFLEFIEYFCFLEVIEYFCFLEVIDKILSSINNTSYFAFL